MMEIRSIKKEYHTPEAQLCPFQPIRYALMQGSDPDAGGGEDWGYVDL